MKKLLLLSIMLSIPMMANASIVVEDTTNEVVLRNQGFSKGLTKMVNASKARANSQEYYSDEELQYNNPNKFVRFWRKFYAYMDPAAETYSIYHHDIEETPSYTDL